VRSGGGGKRAGEPPAGSSMGKRKLIKNGGWASPRGLEKKKQRRGGEQRKQTDPRGSGARDRNLRSVPLKVKEKRGKGRGTISGGKKGSGNSG